MKPPTTTRNNAASNRPTSHTTVARPAGGGKVAAHLMQADRSRGGGTSDLGAWRDITDDAAAKEVFIRMMERMDKRYVGLGAPSAPLKNPLDQQIDQHRDPASPRGMVILAWSPGRPRSTRDRVHLAIAVSFSKPVNRKPGLEGLVLRMIGVNFEIYKRPPAPRIEFFGRLMRDKLADLANVGLEGNAPRGASGIVVSYRPRTMTWKPAWRLHNVVFSDPGIELIKEREERHAIYWRFKVTKL